MERPKAERLSTKIDEGDLICPKRNRLHCKRLGRFFLGIITGNRRGNEIITVRDDPGILSATTYLKIMSELSTVQDKVDVFPTISALLWFNWNVKFFLDRFGTKNNIIYELFSRDQNRDFLQPGLKCQSYKKILASFEPGTPGW